MKTLKVRMSEDDPREGKSLNEWYEYVTLYADSRLNVTRDSELNVTNS
jgi:hypothetical protein